MRIKPVYVSECRCELGEGLATGSDNISAWVDISEDIIYFHHQGRDRKYHVRSKATVIFRILEETLEFGSEEGVFALDLRSGDETLLINAPEVGKYLRSNDGCYIGNGKYFLGFMHKLNPEVESGQIYFFDGEVWHLIDDAIGIPNTFLYTESGELLVSDSLLGVVWRYVFDENFIPLSKNKWIEFKEGSPDGGMIFENYAFIAIWDGGCVARIHLDTMERHDYEVPVMRPTNCSVNSSGTMLWITSAYEGLTQDQIAAYPLSGSTLAFEIVV